MESRDWKWSIVFSCPPPSLPPPPKLDGVISVTDHQSHGDVGHQRHRSYDPVLSRRLHGHLRHVLILATHNRMLLHDRTVPAGRRHRRE